MLSVLQMGLKEEGNGRGRVGLLEGKKQKKGRRRRLEALGQARLLKKKKKEIKK